MEFEELVSAALDAEATRLVPDGSDGDAGLVLILNRIDSENGDA